MRIPTRLITLLLFPLCAVAQPASPHVSPPMDRDHSVIDTFQVMCNLEPPVFSRIDAKAAAMRMHLQDESTAPAANGATTRHKVWVGALTDGPFALLLDEMTGPRGTATSCAVAAQVPDVNRFRTVTVTDMKLPPAAAQPGQGGETSSEWPGVSGPGSTLILRSIAKGEQSSVMMKLVFMQPRQ